MRISNLILSYKGVMFNGDSQFLLIRSRRMLFNCEVSLNRSLCYSIAEIESTY